MLWGACKGKPPSACSAYLGRPRHFTGLHCWARGYWVSTGGGEEAVSRQYIRHQEEQEKRAAPLAWGDFWPRRAVQSTHVAGPVAAPCGGLLPPRHLGGPPTTAASAEGFL